jgi:hypothetical protein
VKRTTVIAIGIFGVLTLVLGAATPAGAAKFAKFHFDTDHVTLTIPTPPCRPTHGTTSCQWTLAVTENVHGPVVGRATGTSGVLRVAYPPTYCGVIHAAALVGPPSRKEVGFQRTIGTCPTPAPAPAAAASKPVLTAVTSEPTALQGQSGSSASHPSGGSQLPFTGAPILDMLGVGLGCLVLAALCLRKRPTRWTLQQLL